MDQLKGFTVLKEHVHQQKINIDFDRRKSIEYYNKNIANRRIKPSQGLVVLRYLSSFAGYGLLIGLFVSFFIKPWYYGLIICLTAIYIRYQVWKRLKNQALAFTKQQAMDSENNFKKLYTDHVITLKNIETGKVTRHPEKWTQALK